MYLLDSIGNTPLIKLKWINPSANVSIYAKYEGLNPGGSIKDRPALFMIQNALQKGQLTSEKTILEATSGNMGIALAMIGSAIGIKVKIVLPDTTSPNKLKVIKAFGAETVFTPGKYGTDGAIETARSLYERNPEKYFIPNQFDNKYNLLAHYYSTGPEILTQMREERIDYLFAGIGTTGTIIGIGKYLKEKIPDIKVVGIEPYPDDPIEGLKNLKVSRVPKIFDPLLIDEIMNITSYEANRTSDILAKNEGILAGLSSGAILAGAIKYLKDKKNVNAVVILPDRGERYF